MVLRRVPGSMSLCLTRLLGCFGLVLRPNADPLVDGSPTCNASERSLTSLDINNIRIYRERLCPLWRHDSNALKSPISFPYSSAHSASRLAMGSSRHRPSTLFSLVPYEGNSNAQDVVSNPYNEHLARQTPDGLQKLDVGFDTRTPPSETLATVGRQGADIIINHHQISALHCSFKIDLGSNVVLLEDNSRHAATQIHGSNATPFEPHQHRRVVVLPGKNSVVGMAGYDCKLFLFELQWLHDAETTISLIQSRRDLPRTSYHTPDPPRQFLAGRIFLESSR